MSKVYKEISENTRSHSTHVGRARGRNPLLLRFLIFCPSCLPSISFIVLFLIFLIIVLPRQHLCLWRIFRCRHIRRAWHNGALAPQGLFLPKLLNEICASTTIERAHQDRARIHRARQVWITLRVIFLIFILFIFFPSFPFFLFYLILRFFRSVALPGSRLFCLFSFIFKRSPSNIRRLLL